MVGSFRSFSSVDRSRKQKDFCKSIDKGCLLKISIANDVLVLMNAVSLVKVEEVQANTHLISKNFLWLRFVQ